MTTRELRAYVLQHRDDQEAISALAARVDANGVKLQTPEQLFDLIQDQEKQVP
jgi:hypothetical protein